MGRSFRGNPRSQLRLFIVRYDIGVSDLDSPGRGIWNLSRVRGKIRNNRGVEDRCVFRTLTMYLVKTVVGLGNGRKRVGGLAMKKLRSIGVPGASSRRDSASCWRETSALAQHPGNRAPLAANVRLASGDRESYSVPGGLAHKMNCLASGQVAFVKWASRPSRPNT